MIFLKRPDPTESLRTEEIVLCPTAFYNPGRHGKNGFHCIFQLNFPTIGIAIWDCKNNELLIINLVNSAGRLEFWMQACKNVFPINKTKSIPFIF